MTSFSELVATATNLPASDVARLADAVIDGPAAVSRLRARTGSAAVRTACDHVVALLGDHDGRYLAGWLNGAAAVTEERRQSHRVDVVWTGPDSNIDTGRLTSQVIVDLIGEAERSLLLASYATNPEGRILAALTDAEDRGVDVSVLYERAADNPAFRAGPDAFSGLRARRLVWPADRRPVGAALHPKFVVVDDRVALVGSANLTGRALDVNMECGILIRGSRHPKAIADHIWSLLHSGEIVAIPSGTAVG